MKENKDFEIDGLLLAQNKEQFQGATVFHLPFTGGTIVKMMTLADVKALLDKQAEKQREIIRNLTAYASHYRRCSLEQWRDSDQTESEPKCTCGLSKILEDLTNNRDE